jgi:hypothetical protein
VDIAHTRPYKITTLIEVTAMAQQKIFRFISIFYVFLFGPTSVYQLPSNAIIGSEKTDWIKQ